MLIEFSVGNFKSFKDLQTLSMQAYPIKSKPQYKWLDGNVTSTNPSYPLLKTKGIFGPNASGKSNLIRAIAAFLRITRFSVKDDAILKTTIDMFELLEGENEKPSFFQIVFLFNNAKFRYGFEATDNKIISEWLFGKPGEKEVFYFTREGKNIVINKNKFPEGEKFKSFYESGNEIVRPNALFLTAVSTLNGKFSQSIIKYFSKISVINGLDDFIMRKNAYEKLEDENLKKRTIKFLNEADIQIKDLFREKFDVESTMKGVSEDVREFVQDNRLDERLLSVRDTYDDLGNQIGQIAWLFESNESEGTKKMLRLAPLILSAIEQGRVLILDEFEARLHTNLSESITQLFNSPKTNRNGAQFIFSSHDTNLISPKLMRRDQICFVKKDQTGSSTIYNLADIKGVRNDESFEKNYIAGKYNAIPKVGDLDLAIYEN